MLPKSELLPSFYDEYTKTELAKTQFLSYIFFPVSLISLYLSIQLQPWAFRWSSVSDTTFPAGPMTHTLTPFLSLRAHTCTNEDMHRALSRGVNHIGSVPPLCLCRIDVSTTMCCAWPAHSVSALFSLYMNSKIVGSVLQIVYLSSRHECNLF